MTEYFQSSYYGAQEERDAHPAALRHFQVGLGSQQEDTSKKLIDMVQKRATNKSKFESRVNRIRVIDGQVWFY